MRVKTHYNGHTLELHRTLGGISFLVNGEVKGMAGGKLANHKVNQTFVAEIDGEKDKGTTVRAELKLGWLVDKVFFYYQDHLVDEKILL